VIACAGSEAIASAAAAVASTTSATTIAAATTSATTAAATEATAATSTTAAAALFAGARFIDGQRATAMLVAIQRGNRGGRFFIRAHLDKSKPLAAPGIAVADDLGGYYRPCAPNICSSSSCRRCRRDSDVQLLTHFGSPYAWHRPANRAVLSGP